MNKQTNKLLQERFDLCAQIGLSLGLVTMPYFFILRSGSELFGNIVALVCFCFLLSPIFTFLKKPNWGRLTLILTMNITVFVYSLALGKASGIHLLVMANLVIPFVIFDYKEKGKIFLSLCVSIGLISVLESQNYMSAFQYDLSPHYLRLLHFSAMFFTSGVLVIIMGHFNRALTRILEELNITNKQFEKTNKSLNNQKKKVEEANVKLIKSQHAIAKKMVTEYDLAHKIKGQFLPKAQIKIRDYLFNSFYDGAVGNRCQYYDVIQFNDHLIIVAVDIELKGVANGYLTVHLNQILHTDIEDTDSSKAVFDKIQDGLDKSNVEFKEAKVLSMYIDLESNVLSYTNKNWGIALYIVDETVNSLLDNTDENQLSFDINSALVIASEGLVDSVNAENESYGYDNLCKTLSHASRRTKNKLQRQVPLISRINQSIKDHVGVVEIPDDRFCFTLTHEKNEDASDE